MMPSDVQDATRGVARATESEGLASIREPGCAAAIWQRSLPDGFEAWINGLRADQLPSVRTVVPAGDVHAIVQQLCTASGLPDSPERTWLVGDIAALSARFAETMNAPYLRLRLDVVETNACRRFHIDAIMARLICTYRGTGTQYGTSVDNADPDHIVTVDTGTPMILRGTLWPETPASGLRHRSPPIEGTGEARLLLVLDPIFNLDEA